VTTPDLLLTGAAVLAGVLILRTLLSRAKRISKEDLMEIVKHGAQIVDVRTPQEFAQAHAKGSRNIPLDQLAARVSELERALPVVVCCASGARSGMAKSMLERAGFTSVHNAGPWQAVG
jgi:phage shock protein E